MFGAKHWTVFAEALKNLQGRPGKGEKESDMVDAALIVFTTE